MQRSLEAHHYTSPLRIFFLQTHVLISRDCLDVLKSWFVCVRYQVLLVDCLRPL